MFTGLLPSEHCTHNGHQRLEDRYTTVAELLREAGYRTFLFSANPQISASPARNFGQGFEATEHPWSPRYRDEALELVERKLPPEDRSSELPERLRQARRGQGPLNAWNIKAAGELAKRATLTWLDSVAAERPWFVFLNYMEAHRPHIPPREYREQMMSEEEVRRSYRVDRSWLPMWEYTFGLREYSEQDLALTRATYDATLRELDDLFAELLEALAKGGHLDDTVVILTSDHGEHLGEQHMLDHQYSLYEPLLRVPLVIRHSGRIEPGRDTRPVVNFDIFPTVLELVGLAVPEVSGSQTVSLLSPREDRVRLAEEPVSSEVGIRQVLAAHPGWDPSPYQRRLRALIDAPYKFIWASDGRHELFDLAADPLETVNLVVPRSEVSKALAEELASRYKALQHCTVPDDSAQSRASTPAERELLEALGYLGEDEDRTR
jgi:arylsulfatase A-like enzyme